MASLADEKNAVLVNNMKDQFISLCLSQEKQNLFHVLWWTTFTKIKTTG